MEVAQRDVVEAVEHARGHLLGAADAERPLALALEAAGHERVGDEHAALVRRGGGERLPHAGGRYRLLVVDGLVAVHVARLGRVGERERADAHRAVLVAQHDGRGRLRQLAHQVHAALPQQGGGEADAHGAVVVAGDGDDRDAEAGDELGEHVVQQVHGLGGRHGAVVEVAGDDDRGRPHVSGKLDQLLQHVLLVAREVDVVEEPPEVPVGRVDEPHGGDPTTAPGRSPGSSREPGAVPAPPSGGPPPHGGIQ